VLVEDGLPFRGPDEYGSTCASLLLGCIDHTMEALPILNLSSAPQATPSSAGSSPSAKSADAESVPSFAQVVREILVRTTTQSDTQPAHTLQSSSSSKSGKPVTDSGVSRETERMAQPQPANTQALNAVSFVNLSAVALPVAPALPEPQPATSTATANSNPPAAAASSSGDPTPAWPSASTQIILPPTLPDPVSSIATNQLAWPGVLGPPASNREQNSIVSGQPTPLSSPDGSTPQNDKNLTASAQRPDAELPVALAPLTDKNAAAASERPASGIPDAPSAVDSNNLTSTIQISSPSLPDAPPPPSDAKPAAAANQLSTTRPRDDKAVPADQISLPSLPDALRPPSDAMPVADTDQFSLPANTIQAGSLDNKNADQQQASASSQTGDPSSGRKTIADIQAVIASPAALNATVISFLPPQSAPWQASAAQNSSAAGGPSSTAARAAALPQQAAVKAASSSAQLAAALPAEFAPQVSNAKNVPSAQAALPAVVPSANAPSSNRSGSQDGSSNTGTQKLSDSSATPGSAASRDSAAFSQALAAANDPKPQAAPSAGNQPPVTPAITFPLNERSASPAAATLPAAPANPPETAPHLLDGATNPTVSDAQLSQNSNHSEMRIAMQTDKLGAVELHARVSGDEIGAAITVEKRDAHAALAVELPALQQDLADKHFRVDQITLLHAPLHAATGDAGGQSQSQQGDRSAHRAQVAQSFLRDNIGAFVSFQAASETRGIFDSQGRLSVQA
jgi:hypothetical protein